jgi:hypothetical protein
MAWEDVPADVDAFFQTGELPESASAPPTETPDPNASGDAVSPVETGNTSTEPSGTSEKDGAGAPPVAPAPSTDSGSNVYAEELIRQQQATLDRLTKQLADMQKAQADAAAEANKPAPIDPEKDPLGYLTQQIKAVGDQVEAMKTAQTQAQQETAQQAQQRQFIESVNTQIEAFKAKQPDYLDAYNHLVGLRTADYKLRGLTEQQIQQAIGAEEMQILQGAAAQRKNPAELVYALAKQYGYQQKSTQVVPPEKKAESKLDIIKKGLETTGADRGAPPPTYSTESLKEMSGAQLTDAVANHWEEMFGRSGNKGIF